MPANISAISITHKRATGCGKRSSDGFPMVAAAGRGRGRVVHERAHAAAATGRGKDLIRATARRHAPRIGGPVSRPAAFVAGAGRLSARLCRSEQLLPGMPKMVQGLARAVPQPTAAGGGRDLLN